jgi:hypothetical protein
MPQCDEAKPHCANCIKRQVRCEYPKTTAAPNTSPGSHVANSREPRILPISEIELTHYWTTTTCYSLSEWAVGAARWQSLMEDIALSHDHVLHLMFSLAAFHLSKFRPLRREEYIATAEYHCERALALITPEIATINPDNCDAVLVSVQLICFVSWARGPQAGEYLAFGEHGRSEWLVMFRGIRTTLNTMGREKFAKTHAPALRTQGRHIPPPEEPFEYEQQLQELREHVAYVSEPSDSDENVRSMDVLQEMYSNRYNGKDGEYHVTFGWLFRMSDEFLDRLQQRDPLLLIIYAHFVVLMLDMEKFWYMKGWTHHVMSGIFEALPIEDKAWIRWPMASVGWIAP